MCLPYLQIYFKQSILTSRIYILKKVISLIFFFKLYIYLVSSGEAKSSKKMWKFRSAGDWPVTLLFSNK